MENQTHTINRMRYGEVEGEHIFIMERATKATGRTDVYVITRARLVTN